MQNAYSFAFTFLLMFGLVFELPLVIFFLALWGIATGKGLLKFWRYFVVLSFLLSAILTPPEPLSQIMMAIPLNVLYGFGILVAFTVSRARSQGHEDVGRRALRMMGLSMAGAVATGLAIVLVVAGIPDKSLLAQVPANADWAVGVNPKSLLGDQTLARGLRAEPGVAEGLAHLEAVEIDASDVVDGLVVADGELRAVLLRGSEIGARAEALDARLAEGRKSGLDAGDWFAVALAPDVLAIGQRNLIGPIVDVSYGDAVAAARDDEDDRLLKRLQSSGPAWAWIIDPERGPDLLGAQVAVDTANAGAVVSFGARHQVALHVRAPDKARVDTLDGALQAARERTLAQDTDTCQEWLVPLLTQWIEVDIEAADAARKPALIGIANQIKTRAGLDDASAAPPAFPGLAPYAHWWSMRQNDTWFVLTSEVKDTAFPVLVSTVAR